MTKEQLSDKIRAALTPLVEDFVAQPSPGANATEEQRVAIERRRQSVRESLGEDDPAYKAASEVLDESLRNLSVSNASQKKENLRLVAEALVVVTNGLRVPVKLKPKGETRSSAAAQKTDGRRNRKSSETLAEETAAVLKALPRASAAFVPKSDITEKVGFDPTSALLKLKREGNAVSNGRRGAGGGWRKA
ncbi:hypothetical protein [Phycisphaera mikurensis]|uniref:Uncharacterized protein n=1 Tax=Phycisphaera mikurensis (strain NBRC 102666 / KCTC 22515 / FYK2301M01) TaxID=1142394 RepID=I0IBW1_PHYMF|nr:hypothetical protein [Phycisphaera mikurensis]MBB6442025.1 hypothetical protein [Phycisphaera mikurensis]BAM02749.1 hypothetical protein PSMK_05900 [Phycisphaera mikurensis NBRC 102666]